ncbi:unnamed protein product [Cunninghamella echinulata]
MFSNTSRYSTPATTTTSTSYPHLSDHTQRTGSLVEYITMQHQKNENKILHNQSKTIHKKERKKEKDKVRKK